MRVGFAREQRCSSPAGSRVLGDIPGAGWCSFQFDLLKAGLIL